MTNKILWLSTKTRRVFYTYEEAEKDAKDFCMIDSIEYNYKKHVKLVFNCIKENAK